MVIDTSAFVAILQGEPEQGAFIAAIVADRTRLVSAAYMLEASLVLLSRRGEAGLAALGAFCAQAAVQTAGVAPEHLNIAIDAFRRFARGGTGRA